MEYTANLQWESEAAVWIATSDDIIGLVLELGSVDALIERIRYAVPLKGWQNNLCKQDST